MAIMTPRREAHRKVRKGKNEGTASRCNYVAFGDWGLMSLDNERVTSRQIEGRSSSNHALRKAWW